MRERLASIRTRMATKEVSAYYAWYNPKAEYLIDSDNATDDILWMISEIERLRVENNDLKSPRFSELVQKQLKRKLSGRDAGSNFNEKQSRKRRRRG